MAQVTSSIHHHIDVVLSNLLDAWKYLPKAIVEIDDWDLGRQIAYIEEWAPDEQLLVLLHEYERDGMLSAHQSARYQELMAVVQENHPLLDQLREQ